MTSESEPELLAEFIDESTYLLQTLPDLLEEVGRDPSNPDPVHSVFRAVHSIKGNAGFFELTCIKRFAHDVENVLDELREAKIVYSSDLAMALAESFDLLGEMLQFATEDEQAQERFQDPAERLTQQLTQISGRSLGATSSPTAFLIDLCSELEQIVAESGASSESDTLSLPKPCVTRWLEQIQAAIGTSKEQDEADSDTSPNAGEAAAEIELSRSSKYFSGEQEVTNRVLGLLDFFDAVDVTLGKTEATSDAAKQLQEFANELDKFGDKGAAKSLSEAGNNFKTILESPFDLDQNLINLVFNDFKYGVSQLKIQVDEKQKAAENAASSKKPAGESPKETQKSAKLKFVRVREDHISSFADDVSELFTTCERLRDFQSRMADEASVPTLLGELGQINTSLYKQVNELQDGVADLRTVPIQTLFGKIPSMARSLASGLGKQLAVTTSGGDSEIDKSLLEDLDAPLTHVVRNVCDHALETAEEREGQGKPTTGTMELTCELTKKEILITIRDDGRGIDPQKTRKKAIENGILSPEDAARLTDQEAQALIFQPGFSTAEAISDVSGRGVGMDVVRTAVQQHGGEIDLESEIGIGTTFTFKIPIRRSNLVRDGLVIAHRDKLYVVPLESVRRVVASNQMQLKSAQGHPIAVVDGQPVGYASLANTLGVAKLDTQTLSGYGLLLHAKANSACLGIEQIVGLRKVVVNPVPEGMPNNPLVSGVAHLGKGRLALVLSVNELVNGLSHSTTSPAA